MWPALDDPTMGSHRARTPRGRRTSCLRNDIRGVGEADVMGEKRCREGRPARYSRRPMKKLTAIAALLLHLVPHRLRRRCGESKGEGTGTAPLTEEQKTLYALGVLMSHSLSTFDLKPEELAQVQKGLADGVGGVKRHVEARKNTFRKCRSCSRRAWRSSPRRPRPLASHSSTRRRRKPGVTKTASGMRHQADQGRHRRIARRHRPGEGALRRPPHRRQGFR